MEVGFEIEDDYEDGVDKELVRKVEDICLNCEVDGCLRELRWEKREFLINGVMEERMIRVGGGCWKIFEEEMRGGFVSRINGWGNENGLEVMDGIRGWGEERVGKVMDDVWRDMIKYEKEVKMENKRIREEEFKEKWDSGEFLRVWRLKRLRGLDEEIERRNKELGG